MLFLVQLTDVHSTQRIKCRSALGESFKKQCMVLSVLCAVNYRKLSTRRILRNSCAAIFVAVVQVFRYSSKLLIVMAIDSSLLLRAHGIRRVFIAKCDANISVNNIFFEMFSVISFCSQNQHVPCC